MGVGSAGQVEPQPHHSHGEVGCCSEEPPFGTAWTWSMTRECLSHARPPGQRVSKPATSGQPAAELPPGSREARGRRVDACFGGRERDGGRGLRREERARWLRSPDSSGQRCPGAWRRTSGCAGHFGVHRDLASGGGISPGPPPGGREASGNGRRARGRGDAVRLLTRGILRRVSRVAGKARRVQHTFGWTGAAGRKRDEPHGRQRDATSPRHPDGASRQGGEKPRSRNETWPLVRPGRRSPRAPGVDIRDVGRRRGESGRIPREEGRPSAEREL
jgi:hypothetical protein